MMKQNRWPTTYPLVHDPDKKGGTSGWAYVTENYKHPLFHKRNLPNYNGDDVGPFPRQLKP
jgi:hypothetical protein